MLLAFAQRFQYELALGAFAYLGSREFGRDTPRRRRDFTLAVHHLEDAVVAAYNAVLYVLPFAFAASRASGWRSANRSSGILRTGFSCAVGASLSAVAMVPVRVCVELFLAATFLGSSCSIAMLVFVYVAAARRPASRKKNTRATLFSRPSATTRRTRRRARASGRPCTTF